MISLSLLICATLAILKFVLYFFWSALDRLNQMLQVGDSNVQTEATWFMKIGELVTPVKLTL